MKAAILATAGLLAACDPPLMNVPPAPPGKCDAQPAQALVGTRYAGIYGTRAKTVTGAVTLRIIRPGQAVTMDYREDRLNIELDAKNIIVALRCG